MSLGFEGLLELDLTQGSFLCAKWNVLPDVFREEKKQAIGWCLWCCFCVGKGEKYELCEKR